MAKRFFYVCAGLLMLAAAYHLGATKAESQGTGTSAVGVAAFWDPSTDRERLAVGTASGAVYWTDSSIPGGETWTPAQPIPSSIVAFSGWGVGGWGLVAVAANGDVYRTADPVNGSWLLAGNIFSGGPVQIQRSTWGEVKERFSR